MSNGETQILKRHLWVEGKEGSDQLVEIRQGDGEGG
jgi:hypothetical protein